MKRQLCIVLLLVCMLALCACGSKDAETAEPVGSAEIAEGLHHVELVVKDYGTITLELDADAAPITVANFLKLAESGFYDGLTFHRIMDGFMIQGGDPDGNGSGGSGETIKGEFAQNGVDNPISHVKGVISMARAKNPDSASSLFFITDRPYQRRCAHERSELLQSDARSQTRQRHDQPEDAFRDRHQRSGRLHVHL